MISFVFIDSSDEKYTFSFNWREKNTCTIALYPKKFGGLSLAMATFECKNIICFSDDNSIWAVEYLSLEAENYVNHLLKNKVFW